MARGVYVVEMSNVTIASAAPLTLVGIMPGTTRGLEIVRMEITQHGTATSAQCYARWWRQVTSFPTVTSTTPAPVSEGDAVSVIAGAATIAAGKSGVNASAEGAGAKTYINGAAFNNLAGFLWLPSAQEKIFLAPSSASSFGLGLAAIPGSLANWSASVTFKEQD